MTGGALVTSHWLYRRFIHQGKKPKQEVSQESTLQTASNDLLEDRATDDVLMQQPASIVHHQQSEINLDLHHGLQRSTISLGLASTGLLFPPLRYASIPVLLYMGTPSAQEAYSILVTEKRSSRALAETVALAACLAGGFYWVGSLGFTLYYLGRTLQQKEQSEQTAAEERAPLPHTAQLLCEGGDVTVAIGDLQIGDVIVVHSGEVAPATGLITEGVAWLKSSLLVGSNTEIFKRAGDMISATDIILVGRICVQVRSVA